MALAPADDAVVVRTVAEFLDAYGQDRDGYRREFVDGTIIMSPAPARRHQRLSSRLWLVFQDALMGSGWAADQAVNVRLSDTRLVVPDLIVTSATGDFVAVDAEQVALAVEITSPGSVAIDAAVKPQWYAAAGIANYLHIDPGNERSAPAATWHRLDKPGRGYYTVAGRSRNCVIELDAPVPVRLDLGELSQL